MDDVDPAGQRFDLEMPKLPSGRPVRPEERAGDHAAEEGLRALLDPRGRVVVEQARGNEEVRGELGPDSVGGWTGNFETVLSKSASVAKTSSSDANAETLNS
jgi:hypothetical protein